MQLAKTSCTSSEEAVVIDERRQQQGRQEALVLRRIERPRASEKQENTGEKEVFPGDFRCRKDSK